MPDKARSDDSEETSQTQRQVHVTVASSPASHIILDLIILCTTLLDQAVN